MNNENELKEESQAEQPAVSGHIEPVVMLPCKFCCGNPTLDWSGVTEFYGKAQQDLTIDCENEDDENHQGVSVCITMDDNNSGNSGSLTEYSAKLAWNALNLV